MLKSAEPLPEVECTWLPNEGPQTMGYHSKATILGYGGQAGGGKTDLLLGLARKEHTKAVIFRDTFPNLRDIIERSRAIYNPGDIDHSRDSYNESLHRWMFSNRKMIEFEACNLEKDKEKQRGRPRDFYGFDEVTQFSKSQIMFILGWLRTTNPNQQCRVVMTFNPPTEGKGGWVIDYFLPWLAYLHPEVFSHENPAKPGELRWYTTVDGKEMECPNGDAFEYENEKGKIEHLKPISRTFIPASLDDNPYLSKTQYKAFLQTLPEPLRSQLLDGDFSACADDDAWQAIPTAAYDRSVERWKARQPSTAAMNRAGLDIARGGRDNTVKAMIHADGYCGELLKVSGKLTRTGRAVAKLIYAYHDPGDITVAVDVIGIGSSPLDVLNEEGFDTVPINGSGRAMVTSQGKDIPYEDPDSNMRCVNLRSATIWNLRLLLEKDLIDLPPDPRLRRAALAHRWTPTPGGIKILSKDQVKDLIGFSPDEFDAVCYGYWIPVPHKRRSFAAVGSIYA